MGTLFILLIVPNAFVDYPLAWIKNILWIAGINVLMNELAMNAYMLVMESVDALMELDPDLDSPEGELLEAIAKACANYEESIRMNS